ncbi:Uncharacterised protein [uncultured archaeon]|nr:Uncharacterised protein [uncultured archaeon]
MAEIILLSLSRTTPPVKPSSVRAVVAAAISSASARMVVQPIMSASACKNSRKRPFCGSSFLQTGAMQYLLKGFLKVFEDATRESGTVKSKRKARRPSSTRKSCPFISSPHFFSSTSTVSSAGVSIGTNPNLR